MPGETHEPLGTKSSMVGVSTPSGRAAAADGNFGWRYAAKAAWQRCIQLLNRPERFLAQELHASGAFDSAWYHARYPDIAADGSDPVLHYLRHGAAEGRDPSSVFSTSIYLGRHPADRVHDNALVDAVRRGLLRDGAPESALNVDTDPPVRVRTSWPSIKEGRLRVVVELASFEKGGLEKVVLDSAIAFDRARIEPVIVTPGIVGHLGQIAERAGIRVEALPATRTEQAYGAFLDRFDPHLAMSHFSTLGYRLFKRRAIPNITFIHNVYAFMNDEQRRRFQGDDPFVDLYVAVSRKAAQYASANLGISEGKIKVVPNGLIISEHEARERRKPSLMREQFGLSKDDYVFLNPASYNLHKGHYVMAAALTKVLEVRSDIKILCVGNEIYPPHVAQLRAHVDQLGLRNHMLMPGYFPNIEDVMRLADACMLPSFIEGWSIAMNEAMFYRKPLILTDTGGASDVIQDDDIGVLLPNEYPALETLVGAILDELAYTPREYRIADSLAKTMIRFASEREKWARAGELGRRKIYEHYDFRSIVPKYEELMWRVAKQATVGT